MSQAEGKAEDGPQWGDEAGVQGGLGLWQELKAGGKLEGKVMQGLKAMMRSGLEFHVPWE